MLFYSRLYGLSLAADSPIPGLCGCVEVETPNLQIRLLPGNTWLPDADEIPYQVCYVSPHQGLGGRPGVIVHRLADGAWYRLIYSDYTEFLVDRSGKRISSTWTQPFTLDDTATYLLGPVIGFALRLRGTASLHASAVVVDDHAIAFLGDAGAGKSTTAALVVRAGHAALSDDITALDDCGEQFYVQPGYPRLRLWPDSVQSLYGSTEALPRITSTWDKRHLDLTEHFCDQPTRLSCIYALDNTGDAPLQLVEVPPHVALMTLVTNSTVNYLLDRSMRAHEFDVLSRVVAHVPVKRLMYNPQTITSAALSAALRHDCLQFKPRQNMDPEMRTLNKDALTYAGVMAQKFSAD